MLNSFSKQLVFFTLFLVIIGCSSDTTDNTSNTEKSDYTINDFEYEIIDKQKDYLTREYKLLGEDYFLEVYANINNDNTINKINQIVLTNNFNALVLNFNINNELNRIFVQSVSDGSITEDYYLVNLNNQLYIRDKENTTKLEFLPESLSYNLFDLQDPISIKLQTIFNKNGSTINHALEYLNQKPGFKSSNNNSDANSTSLLSKLASLIRNQLNKTKPKEPSKINRATCIGVRGKPSTIKNEIYSDYRCSEPAEEERKKSNTLTLSTCDGDKICFVDCNGDKEGTAYYDNCNKCVGGNTKLTPCTVDCNNIAGGTAYLNECNVCVMGNTGKTEKEGCDNPFVGTWTATNFNGIAVGQYTKTKESYYISECNFYMQEYTVNSATAIITKTNISISISTTDKWVSGYSSNDDGVICDTIKTDSSTDNSSYDFPYIITGALSANLDTEASCDDNSVLVPTITINGNYLIYKTCELTITFQRK